MKSIEGTLEKNGQLRLFKKVRLAKPRRVRITFLDDDMADQSKGSFNAGLSESALVTDWNRPEEDEAWQHLQ